MRSTPRRTSNSKMSPILHPSLSYINENRFESSILVQMNRYSSFDSVWNQVLVRMYLIRMEQISVDNHPPSIEYDFCVLQHSIQIPVFFSLHSRHFPNAVILPMKIHYLIIPVNSFTQSFDSIFFL